MKGWTKEMVRTTVETNYPFCNGVTKDEAIQLAHDLLCELKQTRKETAEKFAERLKEKIRRQEERFANEQHRLEEKLPNLKYESDISIVKSQADKANGQATMASKVEFFIDEIAKEFTENGC